MPVKAISEWLGHSSVSITLDMYVHSDIDLEKLFEENVK